MTDVSAQSIASSAGKTAPTVVAQVSMSFNPEEHTLQVSFSRVKQVLYTIRYQIPAEVASSSSVTQALSNRGLADTQGRFSATHFLGSESGDQKIKHDVKTGVIQANIITAQGKKERVVKSFTLDAQNQIMLKEADLAAELQPPAAVLGATTAIVMPSPSLVPVIAEATPAQSRSIFSGVADVSSWVWLIVIGIVLMVTVVIALLRQSGNDVSE